MTQPIRSIQEKEENVMAMLDLFREMDNLRRDIDNVFRGYGRAVEFEPSFLPGLGTGRYPQVNLREDNDHIFVDALVPGIDPTDLELSVLRNTLTLSGLRREVKEKATWHRNERGGGKFLRTIELPAEVDADKVKAECRNGVLSVTLPKSEAARPKKISVKPS
jgi:HSP20 family protein